MHCGTQRAGLEDVVPAVDLVEALAWQQVHCGVLGELLQRRGHGTLLCITRGGTAMTDVVDAPTTVKPINHWISGARYPGKSGRTGPVFNPATGEQSGAVDFATVEEVDRAVQAAKQALPAWRALSLAKRAELFFAHPRALPREARRDRQASDAPSTARCCPTRWAR